MKYAMAILMLLILLTGCAQSISQEQYNSLQSELKTTKEQLTATKAELETLKTQIASTKDPLETTRQTWSAMIPYLNLYVLLMENQESWLLKDAGKILASEFNIQTMDQSTRFKDLLNKIDNADFVSKAKFAWYDSQGKDKSAAWADLYNFLRAKLQTDMEKMNSQLKP